VDLTATFGSQRRTLVKPAPDVQKRLCRRDTLNPGLPKFANGWSAYLYLGWCAICLKNHEHFRPLGPAPADSPNLAVVAHQLLRVLYLEGGPCNPILGCPRNHGRQRDNVGDDLLPVGRSLRLNIARARFRDRRDVECRENISFVSVCGEKRLLPLNVEMIRMAVNLGSDFVF